MKLFLADKKKNILLTAIIIIGFGGIIYSNFFYGRAVTVSTEITNAINSPASDTPVIPSDEESVRTSPTLPHGSTLKLKILDQDLFRRLRPFTPARVLPNELGQPNPF